MGDFIKVSVGMFICMFICIILPLNYYLEYTCSSYSKTTGKTTKWVYMDNCYIYDDTEWLRIDHYEAAIIAKHYLRYNQ